MGVVHAHEAISISITTYIRTICVFCCRFPAARPTTARWPRRPWSLSKTQPCIYTPALTDRCSYNSSRSSARPVNGHTSVKPDGTGQKGENARSSETPSGVPMLSPLLNLALSTGRLYCCLQSATTVDLQGHVRGVIERRDHVHIPRLIQTPPGARMRWMTRR